MDFGVPAKEKSIDPSSEDGGYIGGLSSTQMTPALRKALKGLRSRQFTGIVRVPSGFAILTVFPVAPKTQDLNAKQIQSLATAGVVRQTINVAGMSEEDSVFEQYPKPANWKQDLRQPWAIRKASHPAAVERMEQILAGSGGGPGGKPGSARIAASPCRPRRVTRAIKPGTTIRFTIVERDPCNVRGRPSGHHGRKS